MGTQLPLIEIALYYLVILASPVISIVYLKHHMKIGREKIRQHAMIFGFFYTLIAVVGVFAFLGN